MMSADRRTPGTFSYSLGTVLGKLYTKLLMRCGKRSREEYTLADITYLRSSWPFLDMVVVVNKGSQRVSPFPNERTNIFRIAVDRKNRGKISRSNMGIAW